MLSTLEQPYPGNEQYNFGFIRPELQFKVHKKPAMGKYLIYDRLTEFQVFIKKSCLTNHRFDLSWWFAHQRVQALNICGKITHSGAMDYAISIIATKLLTDGITLLYPCTNPVLEPKDRFYVHLANYGSDEYIINNIDLELFPRLPINLLEDTLFDLVAWYRQYVNNFGAFESWYINTHLGHDHQESPGINHSIWLVESCTLALVEPGLESKDQTNIEFEFNDPKDYPHNISELQIMSNMEDESLGDLNSYQFGSVGNVLIDRLKMVLM